MAFRGKRHKVDKKRAAVWDALWKDTTFKRLVDRQDKLIHLWNVANAYHDPNEARLDKLVKRASKRVQDYADAALRKAGVY